MYMNNRKDLRVRRSQAWLQTALYELMQEKSYKKIKIKEIVERANVSRPTFYLHYESKDDLLLSLFNNLFAEFQAASDEEFERGEIKMQELALLLFEHGEKHAESLRILSEAGVDHLVEQRIRSIILDINKRYRTAASLPEGDLILSSYVVDFVTTGTLALLKRWITEDMPIPSEKLGTLLNTIASALRDTAKDLYLTDSSITNDQ